MPYKTGKQNLPFNSDSFCETGTKYSPVFLQWACQNELLWLTLGRMNTN